MAQATSAIATGMDAVYYLCKDLQRGRVFYESVLGLRPAWEGGGEEGQFAEYALADGSTFGLGHLPGTEWHESGGIMFAVGDVKEALERVKQAGGTVSFDLYDSPVCTMAWVKDTEGNSFCLHKRTTQ